MTAQDRAIRSRYSWAVHTALQADHLRDCRAALDWVARRHMTPAERIRLLEQLPEV
jgi:hypothetical protein